MEETWMSLNRWAKKVWCTQQNVIHKNEMMTSVGKWTALGLTVLNELSQIQHDEHGMLLLSCGACSFKFIQIYIWRGAYVLHMYIYSFMRGRGGVWEGNEMSHESRCSVWRKGDQHRDWSEWDRVMEGQLRMKTSGTQYVTTFMF